MATSSISNRPHGGEDDADAPPVWIEVPKEFDAAHPFQLLKASNIMMERFKTSEDINHLEKSLRYQREAQRYFILGNKRIRVLMNDLFNDNRNFCDVEAEELATLIRV
jgi:hypothetical protein